MRNTLFLFLVAVALAGCTADTSQPTPEPVGFEISPPVDSILINRSVEFELVDTETGKPVERPGWRIASPHNVPGDRGVMRSDGRYTAPRIAPEPPSVRIEATSGGRRAQAEFVVLNPDWPPEGTPRPGDSHTHPVFGYMKINTSKPIDAGLRVGESVRIMAFDRTGRPVVVSHHEIVQNNRVVDYAGTITPNGMYTAPSVVPDPPRVQINILYLREGGEPGSLSLLGKGIEILP